MASCLGPCSIGGSAPPSREPGISGWGQPHHAGGWPLHRPDVSRLAELIAAGQVPRIDRSFALDEIVAALRWIDDGPAGGKVLVIP